MASTIVTQAKSLLTLHLVSAFAAAVALGTAALFSTGFDRVVILAGLVFAGVAYFSKNLSA